MNDERLEEMVSRNKELFDKVPALENLTRLISELISEAAEMRAIILDVYQLLCDNDSKHAKERIEQFMNHLIAEFIVEEWELDKSNQRV